MTPSRQRIRRLLITGYLVTAFASFVFAAFLDLPGTMLAGRLSYTAGYLISAAAVAALTAHLSSSALNDGVRRAFLLSAAGAVALTLGELLEFVTYRDYHVRGEYQLSAAAFTVGTALLACGYWLWSKEPIDVTPPAI